MNNGQDIPVDDNVYEGLCLFFSPKKGYGFLSWEKDGIAQKDIFVYWSNILCDGFKTINKDDKVSFQIGLNHKGQPKAVNVKVIK